MKSFHHVPTVQTEILKCLVLIDKNPNKWKQRRNDWNMWKLFQFLWGMFRCLPILHFSRLTPLFTFFSSSDLHLWLLEVVSVVNGGKGWSDRCIYLALAVKQSPVFGPKSLWDCEYVLKCSKSAKMGTYTDNATC